MRTDTESVDPGAVDPWERLAEHRDLLEMCIEEETPFSEHARQLLDRLDEEGY